MYVSPSMHMSTPMATARTTSTSCSERMSLGVEDPFAEIDNIRLRKCKVEVLQHLCKEESATIVSTYFTSTKTAATHESRLSLRLPPSGISTLFTAANAMLFLDVSLSALKISQLWSAHLSSPVIL